jgi:hypothetical protein
MEEIVGLWVDDGSYMCFCVDLVLEKDIFMYREM